MALEVQENKGGKNMFENTQNVGMYKCKSCGRMIQMENSCEKPIRCPVCGNKELEKLWDGQPWVCDIARTRLFMTNNLLSKVKNNEVIEKIAYLFADFLKTIKSTDRFFVAKVKSSEMTIEDGNDNAYTKIPLEIEPEFEFTIYAATGCDNEELSAWYITLILPEDY